WRRRATRSATARRRRGSSRRSRGRPTPRPSPPHAPPRSGSRAGHRRCAGAGPRQVRKASEGNAQVLQVLLRQGTAIVEDVPAPAVSADTILVEVLHSCISVGTEMASLNMSALPLYRRALKQPENV